MVTPHLTIKDIPMIVVNHTYKEMALFPKDIVSGGTGSYYSADNIFIIGRQQDKQGQEIVGYHFIINVEKSRYVKEKSKIPITVSHGGGISRWSGLLDVALDGKFVIKTSPGWYQKVDPGTGEVLDQKYREKDTNTKEFWMDILTSNQFNDYITKRYQVGHDSILKDGEFD
jgi:hypothetical protein